MKKILAVTILSLVAFVAMQFSICDAKIPPDEMYLGSVSYGTSLKKLTELHGKAYGDYSGMNGYATYAYGGDRPVLVHYNRDTGIIHSVHVLEDETWRTPSGIGVGSTISEVLKLYGEPDHKRVGNEKTAYCYVHKTYDNILKRDVTDFGLFIVFDNASRKIVELEISGDTDVSNFEEDIQGILAYMADI